MSYRALNWAWESTLPTTQKFVLVALADMADERNTCFPGQERLASMIGASVSTVHRAVKELETAGYVSRVQRRGSDGMRTSDRYHLNVNRSDCKVGAESHRSSEVGSPVNDAALTGHSDRVTTREPPVEPPVLLSPDESDDAGTLIPDAWCPNRGHADKAASLHLDVNREHSRFRAHAERTHRRLKNWNAGFTNWLKQSAVFAQQRQGAPSGQSFAQMKQSNTLALVERYREEESHEEVRDRDAAGLQALPGGR